MSLIVRLSLCLSKSSIIIVNFFFFEIIFLSALFKSVSNCGNVIPNPKTSKPKPERIFLTL